MPPAPVTRRTALRSGLALPLLLALPGCLRADEPDAPDLDLDLAAAAAAREERLVALYDAALATHPALAATIAPLRAEHAAHAEALRVALPSPTGPGAAGPAGPGGPAGPAAAVSADQGTAVRELVTAETGAVAEIGGQVAGAGPALAALLVSILGSEAAHAALLSGGLGLPVGAPA